MTACFISNAKVAAGLAPFRSVRRNAASSGPELREEMREFVTQGAIDLRRAVRVQARIERDYLIPKVRTPGCTPQLRIPLHAQERNECLGPERTQEGARFGFKLRVTALSEPIDWFRREKCQLPSA